jgi:hypothetical protein
LALFVFADSQLSLVSNAMMKAVFSGWRGSIPKSLTALKAKGLRSRGLVTVD